ncbi:tail fiber assembly protein [Gilliamella sp. B2838]|nr:tail fiber assembly protein [Gilliamella sp. B2838]
MATDDEKQLLEQLELFTINVARIDVSDVDAVFPKMPE